MRTVLIVAVCLALIFATGCGKDEAKLAPPASSPVKQEEVRAIAAQEAKKAAVEAAAKKKEADDLLAEGSRKEREDFLAKLDLRDADRAKKAKEAADTMKAAKDFVRMEIDKLAKKLAPSVVVKPIVADYVAVANLERERDAELLKVEKVERLKIAPKERELAKLRQELDYIGKWHPSKRKKPANTDWGKEFDDAKEGVNKKEDEVLREQNHLKHRLDFDRAQFDKQIVELRQGKAVEELTPREIFKAKLAK